MSKASFLPSFPESSRTDSVITGMYLPTGLLERLDSIARKRNEPRKPSKEELTRHKAFVQSSGQELADKWLANQLRPLGRKVSRSTVVIEMLEAGLRATGQ